ncbi:MAG: DUF3618 domain-containing protein [Alphaproteobacteria bacterium]|jgi:hypothetical protein|nr:MAG: DUF3618 domain-containing protein [Alphaproteobacteria bacterium]
MTETDKIEAEINRSRHALNDTIEQLGGKLSPGQIVDEALGLAQGQLGQFTGNLGRTVRDNPVPLLLIGAGIGMLMLQSRNGQSQQATPSLSDEDWRAEHHFRKVEKARESVTRADDEEEHGFKRRLHDAQAAALDMKQHAGEAYDAFHARVTRTVEGLERRAGSVRDSVQAGFSKAGTFVGEQARNAGAMAADARDQAGAFYKDNPLAAGSIGVALGALIGALTPLSNVERDGLHGVADKTAKAAADLAERGADAVQKAASNIVH